MTTPSIHAKVAASALGSVLAGAGFAIAVQAGAHPSADLITSVTALVTFAVGWLVPSSMLTRVPLVTDDTQPMPVIKE